MIGVIANLTEYGVVCEFFELFKTPWEFYQSNQRYKVLLCTDPFVKRLVSEMRAKPDRCLWGVALGGGFDSRARALREAREGPGAYPPVDSIHRSVRRFASALPLGTRIRSLGAVNRSDL